MGYTPLETHEDETLPTLRPLRQAPFTTHVPEVDVAARSETGLARPHNEDQFLVAQLGRWVHLERSSVGASRELTSPQGLLLVVADGMGGHGGGDVASAVALDSLVEHTLLAMPWLSSGTPEGDAILAADMRRFAIECQARLGAVAARKGLPPKLGTTLTAAYVAGSRLVLMHVGDTRAYLWRAGVLHRLSRDHTLAEALGARAAASSRAAHILMNAIGGSARAPEPDLSATALRRDDRVLVCSDGLYGPVSDERITELLGSAASAASAVDDLIAEALAEGGPDNVTAVAAFG